MTEPQECQADLDLVKEVMSGGENAVERFSERMNCVPRILAAQNARMGRPLDEHDLADLTQDVLILIWKKLDQFEGRSPIEGWVYRVCCLELMNSMRRKRRRLDRTEELPGKILTEPAANTRAEPWEYEDVYRGLDWLSEQESAVIRLKHFKDLTFDEIGAAMDISPNTAKTWYYRGLNNLQTYFETKRETERERATLG